MPRLAGASPPGEDPEAGRNEDHGGAAADRAEYGGVRVDTVPDAGEKLQGQDRHGVQQAEAEDDETPGGDIVVAREPSAEPAENERPDRQRQDQQMLHQVERGQAVARADQGGGSGVGSGRTGHDAGGRIDEAEQSERFQDER